MSASLALSAAAQILPIVIPLQKPPPQIARPVAPIEIAGPAFAAACKDWDDYDKPAPPVRIFGNSYLVGTCGTSSILITGNEGDVLIDGGTEKDPDLIAANIAKLGFRLDNVKILLVSDEHYDHAGGLAQLQRMTGAQLMASPAAAAVLDRGTAGADDPQAGTNPPFPAASVDRVIGDGEQVRLGNIVLTAAATPGQSPGALTWHWGSCDGGLCRQIVYAGSPAPKSNATYRFTDHPAYLAAYQASIAKIAALACDILVTSHPSESHMIDRLAGRLPIENADACRGYAALARKELDDRLAKEAASPKNGDR